MIHVRELANRREAPRSPEGERRDESWGTHQKSGPGASAHYKTRIWGNLEEKPAPYRLGGRRREYVT